MIYNVDKVIKFDPVTLNRERSEEKQGKKAGKLKRHQKRILYCPNA